MAAHPPSKPHVEGDGFSQPHVLHWESPGTRGINGYSVQVKVDGPAGDGKFAVRSLLAPCADIVYEIASTRNGAPFGSVFA